MKGETEEKKMNNDKQEVFCKIWKIEELIEETNRIMKEKAKEGDVESGWCYVLLEEEPGIALLVEVYYNEKGYTGYCSACTDIVSKEAFDEILKEDVEYYNGESWEEYRSHVFKNIFKSRRKKE